MRIKFYTIVLIVIAFSCSIDQEKVAPSSGLLMGDGASSGKVGLNLCSITYSVNVSGVSTSLPYKTWIASAINDFNNKGTYIKFEDTGNSTAAGKILIRFLSKESFKMSKGEGIFAFPDYSLTRIDSTIISLNSDYNWEELSLKKAIAYHFGQLLGLSHNDSDEESILNPDFSQTYKGMSSEDILSLQSLYGKDQLAININKGSVSARSIAVSWATTNPTNKPVKGSGLCWSQTNISPTVANERNYYANVSSGNWATGWNFPGATVYIRSYIVTECETLYSPVIKISVPLGNTWEVGSTAPFSSRSGSAVIATDGIYGKAFIIGGTFSTGELTNEVWMHQPGLNLWKLVKPFPGVKREGAAFFSFEDKIYYGLGYINQTSSFLKDWWEYSISADTWSQKNSVPSISKAGALGFATKTGGIITLGYGIPIGTLSTLTLSYNPNNDSWSNLPSFPVTSGSKGFSMVNNTPYILLPNNRFLGFNVENNFWFQTSNLSYDIPSVDLNNQHNTMVSCQGKVYYGSKNLLTWYQFNPDNSSWNQKKSSPAYFLSSSFLYSIGDKIYVLDGKSRSIWEYNVE